METLKIKLIISNIEHEWDNVKEEIIADLSTMQSWWSLKLSIEDLESLKYSFFEETIKHINHIKEVNERINKRKNGNHSI